MLLYNYKCGQKSLAKTAKREASDTTKYVYSENITLEKRRKAKTEIFYLVDSRVVDKHESVAALPKRYVFDSSRKQNTVEAYNEVITTMLKRKLGKNTLLVAIGGGMVHDLGGFVAATYLRGIKWIYVPTTLVGMADSAVGGRCGLYFDGKDCALGSNYPPVAAIMHYPFVRTLSDEEWLGGLCEIVKTAITDKKTFAFVEENFHSLLTRKEETTKACLEACKKVKAVRLKSNPFTLNRKKGLKIGRTLGLALESIDGKTRSRGEYVIFGLLLEMSMFKADISPAFYNRVCALVEKLELKPLDFSVEKLVDKCFEYNGNGTLTIPVPWYYGIIAEKKVDQSALIEFLNAYRTR